MILSQISKFLSSQNKVTIIHDNENRIHKIGNIPLNWNESNIYKLMILSCTKIEDFSWRGLPPFTRWLIFNDKIEVSASENVYKFFKKYEYIKLFTEGLEIIIIIKDILPVDILNKYLKIKID